MHSATLFSAKMRPIASRAFAGTSLTALALLSLLGHSPAQAAAPEPRVALAANTSPAPRLRQAHFLGRLEAGTPLRAGLVLPLRNQNALAELLRRQYTPGDSQFHHFLSPRDFTAQFGPTPEDYAAVTAYARAQGLTVTATSPGRTLLNVSGPSSRIESAFGVQMSRYQMADGRVVFSNSVAPTLPRSVAARVAGIAGLSNIARMHPHLRRLQTSSINPNYLNPNAPVPITGGGGGIGSGPLGGLTPNDIKYAYDLSTVTPLYGAAASTTTTATGTALLNGAHQNIGLFELDGYNPADIATYATTFALPAVLTGTAASLTPITLGGFSGTPILLVNGQVDVDSQTEVELDIDMILALAPAPTGLYVYEDDQNVDASAPLTIFTRMANDLNPADNKTPLVQVISTSWGLAESLEDPVNISGENTLFQQMAAQGQSLFCASSDNGAYDLYNSLTTAGTVFATSPDVDNPASQPYATGVGGTTLNYVKPATNTMTGTTTSGTYTGETVWSAGAPTVDPEGSGGGISSIWSKPSYQLGFGASPTRRDVPDVALNADPNTGYTVFYAPVTVAGGTAVAPVAEVVGGTSAAAPLWAAFTALINERRTANGLTTPIGFLNPLLYPLAANSATYGADFHDVLTGSNLFYSAGAGYDDATGLGSFIGAPLIAALSVNANAGTGTATVTGMVTDSSSPAQPVVGATVTATASSAGSTTVVATAATDASGNYTLTVPSGITLQITVNTTVITAPVGETFTGTVISLPALTAATSATENFALSAAYVYPVGLQMISAPFDYTGIGSFASVFGLTAAQASVSPRLVQYSPLLNSYVFYPTAPADTLRLGQGYWIRFPSANYLHIAGNSASTTQPFSISLQPGWNQIGDPFPAAAPLSGVTVSGSSASGPLASTPSVVGATLYSYDMSTSTYATLAPATGALTPYVGYWIFAFQPCTLNIPVPAGLATTAPPAAPV